MLTGMTLVTRVRPETEGRDPRSVGELNESGGESPVKRRRILFAGVCSYACFPKTRALRGLVPSAGQDQSAASPAHLAPCTSSIRYKPLHVRTQPRSDMPTGTALLKNSAHVRPILGAPTAAASTAQRGVTIFPSRQNPASLTIRQGGHRASFPRAGHAELDTNFCPLGHCTGPSHQWNLAQHLRHHIVPPLKQVAETYGPQFPCEKQIPVKRSVHRESGLKRTLVDNIGLVTH